MLKFTNRKEFHDWLSQNGETSEGVWLIFNKEETLSANDALEEALCFGWIDGKLQKIDDFNYKKYFARRTKNSKWSKRNKEIAINLEKQGFMSVYGLRKMEEAKKNGQWDAQSLIVITKETISDMVNVLRKYEGAHANFLKMSPSVQKTYTRAYLDAKTEVGREKRLEWIVDRLNKNLKPM